MSMSPQAFNELLDKLDLIDSKQTFKMMLRLQEVAAGDIDPIREAAATFNALTEEEAVAFLKIAKAQFNTEDWETIMEII